MLGFFKKAGDFIRQPTHGRTAAFFLLLLLAIAIPLTVTLSQKQQEIRQRASEGEECRLDTASCETNFNQCLQKCDQFKTTTSQLYTCIIYSYSDQNCQTQVNAIGGGTCGTQNNSSGCNDLGEENGSSKTACSPDSTCPSSNSDENYNSCTTACGTEKSICDNNVTTQYNNCLSQKEQAKKAAEEAVQKAQQPAPPPAPTPAVAPAAPPPAALQAPSTGNSTSTVAPPAAQSGSTPTVPACWKCTDHPYSKGFFNNGRCNSTCGETTDQYSLCFTTDCAAPSIPQPISPNNEAVLTGSTQKLSWNEVQQGSNSITYTYFVSPGQTDSFARGEQTRYSTSVTVENLTEGNTYSWKVKACLAGENICSDYSAPQTFTIAVSQIPEEKPVPPAAQTAPAAPSAVQQTASCPDINLYNDLISAYKYSRYLEGEGIREKLGTYLIPDKNGHVELLSFNLLKQAINNCPR